MNSPSTKPLRGNKRKKSKSKRKSKSKSRRKSKSKKRKSGSKKRKSKNLSRNKYEDEDESNKNILEALDKIEYPYLKYFVSPDDIKQKFINLKHFKPKIIHEKYQLYSINISEDDLKFNGQYYLIIDQPYEYNSIELISDYFNEPCRVKCRFITAKDTLLNYYQNNQTQIIKYLEHNKQPITLYGIRETIWKIGYKECSTFKPKLEKYFIELFDAKNVLDISSGWGDRLIGAMASNINCYHGFDPNPCLHPGYGKIIEFFGPIQTNKNATFVIKELPFEAAILKPGYYDLVMSSPPYYNIEEYDTDQDTGKNQSISNLGTHNPEKVWFDKYLMQWINICYHALREAGVLALNINQLKSHHYVDWLLRDMNNNHDNKKKWKYQGVISHSKHDKKNAQPTFIWKKII
jgi:hypothetical protein